MSSAIAIYFLHHEGLSSDKCSWKREYLRLAVSRHGKVRLAKVVEYENKTMFRPACPKLGLPWGVVASTRAEYAAALLRFRKAEVIRQQQLALEKALRKEADEKLAGLRGLGPAPKPAPLRVTTVPELVAGTALFDDFTVVDTEYQGEHLLEVAAIRYKNWQPVGQPLVSYVRCTEWIWPKTTKLTGITEEHVRKAPLEKEVLQSFLQLAEGSLLIAHNVGADRSKIEAARTRQGATQELPNRWFCTLQLARARLPKGTKCGLGELVERFGFSRRGHHQALTDVQMCFQVLRHFHEQAPLRSLDPKAQVAAPTLDFAA